MDRVEGLHCAFACRRAALCGLAENVRGHKGPDAATWTRDQSTPDAARNATSEPAPEASRLRARKAADLTPRRSALRWLDHPLSPLLNQEGITQFGQFGTCLENSAYP